jgi:hypothetical protein
MARPPVDGDQPFLRLLVLVLAHRLVLRISLRVAARPWAQAARYCGVEHYTDTTPALAGNIAFYCHNRAFV